MLSIVTSSLQLYLISSNTSSYIGSGTVWTDLSSNAYNTNIVGNPAFNTTHFTFDGSAQYIDTDQSLSFNIFSIGAWFRTSAGGIKMIFSKETTAGNPWNYRIWMNGGQIICDMSQAPANQVSLSTPLTNYNDGNWHFVMFTRDDSNWYLYMDGAEVNTLADPYTGDVTNSQKLWVGRSAYTQGGASPDGSYQYVGDIAEVFIYDAVLTSTEVLHNYDATKDTYYPPTPTPTPTITPTNSETPTPTETATPTPSITETVTPTPTITITPTSTVYPQVCIQPLLYNSTKFPLWEKSTYTLNPQRTEDVSPCGTQIQAGAILQLSASQDYYSFDYYAIYPPHTIYSAGAYWYITAKGFTASYDPYTIVSIGADMNITGSDASIRAIYR